MDWEAVTSRWVSEGLVEPSQREALLAWLEANAGDPRAGERRSRFLDLWVPGLVAVGTWLITGSALVLASQAAPALRDRPGELLVALAAAQGLVGGAALAAGGRTFAHGAWSAGWLVLAAGVATISSDLHPSPARAALTGALLWALPGLAALLARMPGLAWSGALAGLFALGPAVDAYPEPVSAGLVAGSLAATGAVAGGRALHPGRFRGTDVLVLTPTLVAATALVGWGNDVGGSRWGWLAAAGMVGGWGSMLLAATALSRSGWTLVAAVVAWAVAEGCALFHVGSPLLAAAVLGSEGALVLGLAGAWIAARAGRERRLR